LIDNRYDAGGQRLLRSLALDCAGSMAITAAIVAPLLIGCVSLAVDVSIWLAQKNSAQGIADVAAMSAVTSATSGSSVAQSKNEALAIAAVNGFTNGSGGVVVTVNNPPASGSYTSNAQAYEVIITQPQQTYFAGMFGVTPSVTGRAVATKGITPACILSLAPTTNNAIVLSGSAAVTACGVAANSSGSKALSMSGSACLTAPSLTLVGNYSSSSSCALSVPSIKTSATATADPYAGLAIPTYSGCGHTNYQLGGGSATISPGVYCNGLKVSGGATLTMNAGVYIVDSGDFSVSSSTLIATSGVTVIVTSSSNHYGGVAISGGSNYTHIAPSSGSTAGIAIYIDRNAPSGSNNISGGSSATITGAIYMPSQNLTYSGGSNSGTGCTQLVALTFTFSGPSTVDKNCGSVPVAGLQGANSGLVE